MKSLFDWHALYALFIDVRDNLGPWVCTIIGIRVDVSDGLFSGNQTPYPGCAPLSCCKGCLSSVKSSILGHSCRCTLLRSVCLPIGMLLKSWSCSSRVWMNSYQDYKVSDADSPVLVLILYLVDQEHLRPTNIGFSPFS